jgi:GTP cyclohydrolase II
MLHPVPAAHEHLAAVGQEVEREREGRRVAGRLHHQGDPAAHADLHDHRPDIGHVHRVDPEGARRFATVLPRIGPDHMGAGPLEQRRGEDPDRPEPEHDHGFAEVRTRVERDLQRRLDEREQGLDPIVDVVDRDGVAAADHGDVLMGMEREHGGPVGDPVHVRREDLAHTAVAVRERIREGPAESADRLVPVGCGVELASVRQQLRPSADARIPGADQQLAIDRGSEIDRVDLQPPGSDEPQGACVHGASVPVFDLAQPPAMVRRERLPGMMSAPMSIARSAVEIARLTLPTQFGEWQMTAFDRHGAVHICLCRGELGDGEDVLVRPHSECLTGDALGSLRCDCGVQLRQAFRAIVAEGRGVLIYSTGHEGRGIGLVEKLRAYMLQDGGLDTLEANEHLGFPVDRRSFADVAECLRALGVRSVRLLSNNPAKATALADGGIGVRRIVGLPTTAHARNLRYLTTKQDQMRHAVPMGTPLGDDVGPALDVSALLGTVRRSATKPYVVVKYAQTLDGKIATSNGDARWISGEEERRVSHALRASCDAILVGIGTILSDDPQLTVRMVPGASPIRVVLDSTLRIPDAARVLMDDAATIVVTTAASSAMRRDTLRRRGVAVVVVPAGPHGVDPVAALDVLRGTGIESLVVEGGARVVTSLLARGLADRLIVGIAPRVLGSGTEAIGDLGVTEVSRSLRIEGRSVHLAGDDVLIAGDVVNG